MKACKERWERDHPGKTAPLPSAPLPNAPVGSKEWAKFNAAANEKFNNETLEPCPHCGRTFNEEALARHAPKCATLSICPSIVACGRKCCSAEPSQLSV